MVICFEIAQIVVNIDNHPIQQYFSHIVGLKICRIV